MSTQKTKPKTADKKESPHAWLAAFIRPLRPAFGELLTLSLFINLVALAVPVFVLQIYDRVVFHAGISTLQGLFIGMALVLVFDYVMRSTRSRVMQRAALRVDVGVGRMLFDKISQVPLSILETRSAPYWQTLFRDVDVIRNTVSGAPAVLLSDLPFVFLFLGLILVIAWPIAWVLLLVVPLFLLLSLRSGMVLGQANKNERSKAVQRDALIGEMIFGRATVKALSLQEAMRPTWEESNATHIHSAIHRGHKTDNFTAISMSLTMGTTVVMTTVGAIEIMDQQLTIGALIATNMLSSRIIAPMNQLVNTWKQYGAFKLSVARLGELFAIPGERLHSEIAMDRPAGKITFEKVSFSYLAKAKPVLNELSLTFRAPGLHSLIGNNGSGKTTLIKIAQGLYSPNSGRVLLDDADVEQFARSELASWMGYVPQETLLFAGTLRDNIAHRVPDASDDDIIGAARAAGVHPFILDLPDGYATQIGEAGRRLSFGQRQRITIARALLGDPPVLLLDEPSGSLDHQAEHDLRDTLKQLAQNHTVVVVTHSPILLTACDTVTALAQGNVAASGPTREILPRLFGKPKNAPRTSPAAATPSRKVTS